MKICTEGMSRDEWLEIRRDGLGGSDAAVACNLSKWKTPRHLYHDKRGEFPQDTAREKRMQLRFEMGHYLEPKIIELARRETGFTVNPYRFMQWSEEYPWAFVDMDAVCTDDEGSQGYCECKTVSAYDSSNFGVSGSDAFPLPYRLQVQHGLAVTGMSYGILAVLIEYSDFRWYRIDRDQELIDKLMLAESRFWEHLQKEIPPDAQERDYDVLRAVYGHDGEVVDLPEVAQSWHETLETHKSRRKAHEAGENAIKVLIMDELKDAKAGILPDGTVYKFDARGTMRHSKKL